MKVLFLGSSRFSAIVLEKMLEQGVDVQAIITQPDRPSGRGHKLTPTEVKVMAQEKGIECFTFDKLRNYQEEVEKIDYDVSVVASFGQILPNWFLDHKLCINVHPSLLPKYRGASPLQSAILNGDKVSGVTIMKVAPAVDSGDIILQQEYQMQGEYYCELEEKLAALGGEKVKTVLGQIENGTVSFTAQQHDKATFVAKFEKQDGKLDFSLSASQLENRVRALSETIGTFVQMGENNIKVVKAQAVDEICPQGQIANNKKRFLIGAKQGTLEILQCKAPSGKTVRGVDYINGHNEILGAKVD